MKIKSLFPILCAVVIGVFTACNFIKDENELTDYVSADDAMIIKLNAFNLLESAGVGPDNDVIYWPEYLEDVVDAETKDMVQKLYLNVNFDDVIVAYENPQSPSFSVIGKLYNFDRTVTELDGVEYLKRDDKGKIVTYISDKFTIAIVDKKIAIVLFGTLAQTDIESYLKNIKNNPLSKYPELAQAVSASDDFVVLYNYSAIAGATLTGDIADVMKGNYFVLKGNLVDNKAIVETNICRADGSQFKPFVTLDELNIALLGYIPADFDFVAASGKPTITDKEAIDRIISAYPAQIASYFSMVRPYLESIDGSSVIAVRGNIDEIAITGNYSSIDAIIMTHMPMEKIQEVVNSFNQLLAMQGATPAQVNDNIFMVNLMGKDIYYGEADGYLAISTVGIQSGYSGEFTKYFVNRKNAAVFNGIDLNKYMPFYPLVVAQSENGVESKIEITLEGSDDFFLTTLLKFALTKK